MPSLAVMHAARELLNICLCYLYIYMHRGYTIQFCRKKKKNCWLCCCDFAVIVCILLSIRDTFDYHLPSLVNIDD